MRSTRKTPSTICTECGKEVRLRAAGGDFLNALYPYVHKDKAGKRCEGSFREVETKDILERYRNDDES